MDNHKKVWVVARTTDGCDNILGTVSATEKEIKQFLFNMAMDEKEIGMPEFVKGIESPEKVMKDSYGNFNAYVIFDEFTLTVTAHELHKLVELDLDDD